MQQTDCEKPGRHCPFNSVKASGKGQRRTTQAHAAAKEGGQARTVYASGVWVLGGKAWRRIFEHNAARRNLHPRFSYALIAVDALS